MTIAIGIQTHRGIAIAADTLVTLRNGTAKEESRGQQKRQMRESKCPKCELLDRLLDIEIQYLVIARGIVFCILLLLLPAHPANAQQKTEWTWQDGSGQTHDRSELVEILRKNAEWTKSKGKSGVQADLESANLLGANLIDEDLTNADLTDADLTLAKLTDAVLNKTNLYGANLSEANLYGAHMTDASLDNAYLEDSELSTAELIRVNLPGAHMTRANLSFANLTDAELSFADLTGADLRSANLRGANMNDADISGADLTSANLANVSLYTAKLANTIFEPEALPELRSVAAAKNLELLIYRDNPDALFELRKKFQDGGFRGQERKITYVLYRRETERAWEGCKPSEFHDRKLRAILSAFDGKLANCGSFVLNKVFFDWTCQYGMSPGRPLIFGVLLWIMCSVLYFACIRAPSEAGLYRIYSQGIQENAKIRVVKILPNANGHARGLRRFFHFVHREWLILRICMFFSLMSAFNIGFRDINFGRWLRLLTRQEFDIKAVGWARVVAGWQSLISVFLLALWILTYFGRPFG